MTEIPPPIKPPEKTLYVPKVWRYPGFKEGLTKVSPAVESDVKAAIAIEQKLDKDEYEDIDPSSVKNWISRVAGDPRRIQFQDNDGIQTPSQILFGATLTEGGKVLPDEFIVGASVVSGAERNIEGEMYFYRDNIQDYQLKENSGALPTTSEGQQQLFFSIAAQNLNEAGEEFRNKMEEAAAQSLAMVYQLAAGGEDKNGLIDQSKLEEAKKKLQILAFSDSKQRSEKYNQTLQQLGFEKQAVILEDDQESDVYQLNLDKLQMYMKAKAQSA